MKDLTEMLKGVLEGIVLEVVREKETYGYEITQNLRQLGFSEIVEGTVYTVLLRLEKKELIVSEKKKSEIGPMRKFYTLTDLGEQERILFWEKWCFLSERLEDLRGE